MTRLSKNFTDDEFRCPCCDELPPDKLKFQNFIAKLQDARTWAGVPFRVLVGYRCKHRNSRVGGIPDSSLTKGFAAKLECTGSGDRFLMIGGLLNAGFTRIGIGSDFIFVSLDTKKPNSRIWLY